jgi:hypothetical protein
MIDCRVVTLLLLPLVVTFSGCGGNSDNSQLKDVEVTEQAYLAAMDRMHAEIAPRYFSSLSGELVDESVLQVSVNDVSNCDPDENQVIDTYLRCVLSYFFERAGAALTISLDRYQINGRSTSFKINRDAPFSRWSISIFDDEFTDGEKFTIANLEVDGDLQETSNSYCVYVSDVWTEPQSNVSEIECKLLLQEATIFFDSL